MSAIDLSFRLGGEAGQGVESSGSGFASAFTRAGLQVCATPDYYSRIRGGHNYFTIRVSDEPIYSVKETIELLLALNAETVARHVDALVPGGLIIVDEEIKFDPKLIEGKDVHVVQPALQQDRRRARRRSHGEHGSHCGGLQHGAPGTGAG